MNKIKGMTLTELLIVIGMIAFLATIITYFFRNQMLKANDAKRKGDLNRITVAVEEYEKDNNCYPPKEILECIDGTSLRPYLDKIPCDPVTKTSYYYEIQEGACPKWYKIYSKLDNINDSDYRTGLGLNNEYNFVLASTNAPETYTNDPENRSIYGCFNGTCRQINWDYNINKPECFPNYFTTNCNVQCKDTYGLPINNCI